MTATELIERLQELVAEHGDLECIMATDYDAKVDCIYVVESPRWHDELVFKLHW